MPRRPVDRTPFNDFEKALIRALGNVNYPPGGNHKRFARNMIETLTHRPELGMSEGQRRYMRDMAYRYRRQLPKALAPPEKLKKLTDDEWMALLPEDVLAEVLGCPDPMDPTDEDLEELRAYHQDAIRAPARRLNLQLNLIPR